MRSWQPPPGSAKRIHWWTTSVPWTRRWLARPRACGRSRPTWHVTRRSRLAGPVTRRLRIAGLGTRPGRPEADPAHTGSSCSLLGPPVRDRVLVFPTGLLPGFRVPYRVVGSVTGPDGAESRLLDRLLDLASGRAGRGRAA